MLQYDKPTLPQSKPLIVQPYPTLGTPVGRVVLGRVGRRLVKGRVDSLGSVLNPLTILTLCDG